MEDINIDLSSNHHSISQNDYLNTMKSNAFSSLITNPTRVTATFQNIIDHISTNVHDSVLMPVVFSYTLADHYPIFCKVSISVRQTTKIDHTYKFQNHQAVDCQNFHNDLETALFPLNCDLLQDNVTSQSLENSFEKLVNSITQVIEKHAPLQTASQRQKCIQKKTWLYRFAKNDKA